MTDWSLFKQRAQQFLQVMLEQFKDNDCVKSAGFLTYVTLFALVPFMTVTYSMFSAIPAFQGLGTELQELIFANMVPQTGEEVLAYLRTFSEQARKLTIVGVAFLVISAYFMLTNIEKNFNSIWGGMRGRSGLSKFLLYWAVLTLGPLLLGAGLAMSTYLASLRLFMDEYRALGWLTWLFGLSPWVLTTATFTLLFAAVPNCKVPLRDAFIGGVITAVTFEILKALFGLVVANSSMTSIYGAFAIVPMFLLWVNISWMTILAGGVLVHTIGVYKVTLREKGYPDLVAALLVLWHFHERAKEGAGIKDQELFQLGLSSNQWQRIFESLQRHRMIATTNQGNFVLCRNLHKVTVNQLVSILHLPALIPEAPGDLKQVPWYAGFSERLKGIGDYTRQQLDLTLAELFEQTEAQTEEARKSKQAADAKAEA